MNSKAVPVASPESSSYKDKLSIKCYKTKHLRRLTPAGTSLAKLHPDIVVAIAPYQQLVLYKAMVAARTVTAILDFASAARPILPMECAPQHHPATPAQIRTTAQHRPVLTANALAFLKVRFARLLANA